MENETRSSDLTAVRRRDRAVRDDAWIASMVTNAAVGVMACARETQPFLNSNLFAYDATRHAVYLHTARAGTTREVVEHNPRVCFTVFELGRLLPADTALEFSVEYAGVTLFGSCVVVTDPLEQETALQQILYKYFPDLEPNRDYRPIVTEELKRTTVYRIDIEEWVGKRKRVADDFPGAREFPVRSALIDAPLNGEHAYY